MLSMIWHERCVEEHYVGETERSLATRTRKHNDDASTRFLVSHGKDIIGIFTATFDFKFVPRHFRNRAF